MYNVLYLHSEPVIQSCEWNDEACDAQLEIEETDKGYQITLDIPSTFFKHIIGKKGETRRRLENETKTQIRIPKSGQEGPISKLSGTLIIGINQV